ncbi:MAG TPA: D-alanyl-D-alanine carboxypeptidase family protein [Pseudomonadales bacterium]|nr:D-alanyl-D-alanine carboxypeptidase family protein [Pseudomonadales bacterium]
MSRSSSHAQVVARPRLAASVRGAVQTPLQILLPALLLSLALTLAPAPARAAAMLVPSPPDLAASSWILVDARTGTVLVEHDADVRLPQASLTKLMTDYILAGEIDSGRMSLDDMVPISERAWRMAGSKMFVKVGDEVRLEDLIRGIVVQSGNDATVAVAEYIAGSEAAFVDMMNQQAIAMGLDDTRFENASGMPGEEHFSSARDLAELARRLIQDHPEHYSYYSEKEFTYGTDFQTGAPITQRNRNDLLWLDQTVDGVKTGHTEEAGYCLVASAERDGMRLISAVLGTDSAQSRARESQTLLRYGFRFFETQEVYAGGEELERRQVWKGRADEVAVGLPEDLTLTLPRGRYPDLEAEITLQPWMTAPIVRGDELGSIEVRLDGKVLHSGSLVALEDVEEAGFLKRLWHTLQLFFTKLLS